VSPALLHQRASGAAPWLALAVFAGLLPALYAGGAIDIGTLNTWGKFLAIAVMAIGIDLVWGYTGMLSLCQALFFTLGGYAMGMHLAMHGPLDEGIPRALSVVSSEVGGIRLPVFWEPFDSLAATLALVALVPGAVAFLFGWFAFRSRVRGVYFSIITQALTIAVWLVLCRNEMRLCGTNGLTNFVAIAGFDLREPATKVGLYLLTVATVALTVAFSRWLVRTRSGRVLIAVRDNESRLRFAGYQPVAYKVWIFTVAAILAAIGGALYAPQNGIMTPEYLVAKESVVAVVMVALGGRGTIYGAIVGALLYKYLENTLSTVLANNWYFVLGGLIVAIVLFLPDGLVGAWRKLGRLLREREGRIRCVASTTAPAVAS
jgi:urea transport system permease protein